MIADAQLSQIALNLSKLALDPVLHLKIAVAVVAPLLLEPAKNIPENIPAGAHRRKTARKRLSAMKRRPGRQPQSVTRALEALHAHPSLRNNVSELARQANVGRPTARKAIKRHKTNGDAPPRRRKPNGAADIAPLPDARAIEYLRDQLANGPVECALVDAEVDARRLSSASVERAIAELDLVSVRVRRNGGPRVCYATREQAAEVEAVIPERGGRLEPATPPRM